VSTACPQVANECPVVTRLDITTVRQPTAVDPVTGEITSLPASVTWVHEWEPFWIEIWASTPYTNNFGVAGIQCDLSYLADCTTATQIQYGPAFTESRTGAINDAAGLVDAVGGRTTLTNSGDDAYALFARVCFEPAPGDQVPVDEAAHYYGPYDLGVSLGESSGELMAVGAGSCEPGPPLLPEMWAMIYDIDDSDFVDFGDLSFFVAAFGEHVDSPPDPVDPPYVWWADFDRSGFVDFGDLSYMAANFGGRPNTNVVWPPGVPRE